VLSLPLLEKTLGKNCHKVDIGLLIGKTRRKGREFKYQSSRSSINHINLFLYHIIVFFSVCIDWNRHCFFDTRPEHCANEKCMVDRDWYFNFRGDVCNTNFKLNFKLNGVIQIIGSDQTMSFAFCVAWIVTSAVRT
jgi:hypothetical protein